MAATSEMGMDEPSRQALPVGCHLAPDPEGSEIRVIGPVELVIEGRLVGVRSTRARRVLAVLALYRDRLVSIDRIADAVWGESLPADVPAAVHSQISRLRSTLGPASAAIETAVRRVSTAL